ncbi:MAG: hypothetical protein U1C71_01400 [archaeon]|nr:hypothetical protein [archaeon]
MKKPKIAITKAGEARLKALEINSQPHLAKLTPQIRFQVTMSLILDVMQEMRLHLQEKFLINTMNDPTRRGRVNTYRIIPPITRKSLRDDLKNWLDGEVDKDRGVQRTGKESPSPEILTLIRERKVRIEAFRYALVLVETPAAFKYIDGKSKDIFWETLHLQKQDQYHKRFMDWASKRHPPKSTGES